MSDSGEMSFEVLGTTPTNSYTGSVRNPSPSLLNPPSLSDMELSRMRRSGSNSSLTNSPKSPRSPFTTRDDRQDVAMDILLRRKSPSADLLKSFTVPSLNAEFPSLSNANLTEQDLNKLQLVVAEHKQLRENLVKANAVIKTYFTAVEKWQNDVKQSKEADRRNITMLMENNQKLQRDLHRVQDELDEVKSANSKAVSSGSSASLNDVQMASQLSEELSSLKLELAKTKESTRGMVPHGTFKNIERQCSQLLAENLQIKDMEQQYIDQINCLKVNHASTEELIRMGQMDLNAERAASNKTRDDLNQVKEENQVLIQQAEIYKKDFIAERDARQRMAGEKDELLTELNRLRMMLQTPAHPQMQMQQPQMQMQMQHPQQQQQPHPQVMGNHFGLVRHTCPNCYAQFTSQQLLSQHLPQCSRH